MNKSFNLLDEPWIPVRYEDGRVADVGLLQIFADAGQIRDLAETDPPGLVALYRVLLVIVHRAFALRFGQWNDRDRARCYREGLPVDVIHAYLEHWRERFYVFHPEYPFMQVAALETAEETAKKFKSWTQISLASSSGNAPVVFDHSMDARLTSIPVGQAIRHVLGYLQFVPGGLVQCIRESDNSGPLANTASVLPVGENLSQTLCLCLHPSKLPSDQDLPVWEKTKTEMSALRGEPTLATGPNDRYTRLSRAVLLQPDGDNGTHVSQLRFGAGLALAEDEHAPDTMASYQQVKKGMVRLSFTDGRAVWRDLATFLPDPSGTHALPAPVLGYARMLLSQLGVGTFIPVLVLGLASKKAKILRWRAERFVLPQVLLSQQDAADEVRSYLQDAEALFTELGKIATTMLARGMPDPGHKDTRNRAQAIFNAGPVATVYFSILESHLPRMFEAIAGGRFELADSLWRESCLLAAQGAWTALCRQAGDSAKALRARALSEGSYLGLIKPLRPVSTSLPEESSHV